MVGVGPDAWHPGGPSKFAAGTSDFIHPFFVQKMDEDAEDGGDNDDNN